MLDVLLYIVSGAAVGFAVGLTGVGGGSLMTPLLLLFGYPVPIAIGTDLLYAAATKTGGMVFHHQKDNVRWRIMGLLAAGSIPVSLALNFFVLDAEFRADENFERLLTSVLGVMLILTALVIIFQAKIQRRLNNGNGNHHPGSGKEVHASRKNAGAISGHHHAFELPHYGFPQKHADTVTFLLGVLLGASVTLSSVGAAAFGTALLFILYPHLKAVEIVGTGIVHGVPLTLVAGLGYLYYGQVDFLLLAALVCGSLPGIYLGTHVGSRLPEKLLRAALALLLLGLGVNFSIRTH